MSKVPVQSLEKPLAPAKANSAKAPPASGLDVEAERIAELMERTARAIFKGSTPGSKKLKPEALTLTVAQMRCVRVLSYEKNCTMRDLSRHLGVRPSTACELVDALVRGGFVQRVPDEKDRRVVRLSLASKGRKMHEKHRARRQEHLRSVIDNLSEEQRTALLGALETLIGVLRPDLKDGVKDAQFAEPKEKKVSQNTSEKP